MTTGPKSLEMRHGGMRRYFHFSRNSRIIADTFRMVRQPSALSEFVAENCDLIPQTQNMELADQFMWRSSASLQPLRLGWKQERIWDTKFETSMAIRCRVRLTWQCQWNASTPINIFTGFAPMDVTMKKGTRFGTFRGYLKPIQHRNNLVIYRYAQAMKIHLDKRRHAYGVTYIRHGRKKFVRANREVIVSGGSINSVHLLLLSGIGPKEHLNKKGVRQSHLKQKLQF